jgi:prepilin-type N-terminal cleavage/methylation domain-containing protein
MIQNKLIHWDTLAYKMLQRRVHSLFGVNYIMRQQQRKKPHTSQGFSLIELVVVVAIILTLTAVAIPVVFSTVRFYRLQSTISNVTSLVRATRFQAMSSGYPYQLVFTKTTASYQLKLNSTPNASGGFDETGANGFVNATTAGNSGTVTGTSTTVTLGQDLVLEFSPSGVVKYVSSGTATSCSGAGTNCELDVTYSTFPMKKIVVNGYGNVTVN